MNFVAPIVKTIARFTVLTALGIALTGCMMEDEQVAGLHYKDNQYSGSKKFPIHANGPGKIHVKKCGDWTDDTHVSDANLMRRNHGCAVQNNIAAMIADPKDIYNNGELGPHNAMNDVTSITRASKVFQVVTDAGPTK